MASATPALSAIPLHRISGEPTTLESFRGDVLLVVNVASGCGFTPQYEGLEEIFRAYKDRGFAVLGFPANDFGEQEPGSNQEIASFCTGSFGASFPMFEKLAATGPGKHPLYAALIAAQPETTSGDPGLRAHLDEFLQSRHETTHPAPEVLWNFEKFLLGRDGAVLGRYASDIAPTDPILRSALESALASPRP